MNRDVQIRSRQEKGHVYAGFPNGSLREQALRLANKGPLISQLPEDREIEFPLTLDRAHGRIIDRMDMTRRVAQGVVHFGLTGFDYANEYGDPGNTVEVIREFPFGRKTVGRPTTLVLADYTQRYSNIGDLQGSRATISTEMPRLTLKRLAEIGGITEDDIEIDVSHGATESAGKFGASDLITDVVETGKSLDMTQAHPVAELFKSTPVLLANREALKDRRVRVAMEDFCMLFDAALRSETEPRHLLILNIPLAVAEEVRRILPGSKGENVSPMGGDWLSVNAEIAKDEIPKVIPILLRLGADDIQDVTGKMRWSQKSRIEISEPK